MRERVRSSPGYRIISWLTAFSLVGSLFVVFGPPGAVLAQNDDTGGFPPDGYPRSVVVADEQFLFDRLVVSDPAVLSDVDTVDALTLLSPTDGAPYERLYGAPESEDDGQYGRYLPVQLGSNDPACLADGGSIPFVSLDDGSVFGYAGIETDLSSGDLVELGVADLGDGVERTLYSDQREPPFAEFIVSGEGDELLRFVALDGDVPRQLTGEIPIGDQVFTVDANVASEIDPASLVDVGCVGPFPLRAGSDLTAPFSELFVPVGDGLLRIVAQDPIADEGEDSDATAEADQAPVATAEESEDSGATDDSGEPPIETVDDGESDEATVESTEDESDQTGDGGDGQDGQDGADGQAGQDGEDATADAADEDIDLAEDDQSDSGVAAILPLPEDLPREIVIEDERFLLDRAVPLDRGDLERVGRDGNLLYYAQSEAAPFDALYVSVPPRSDTALARYLPERIGQPDAACLAEAALQSVVALEGVRFAFAGYETDIATENLVLLPTGDGSEVFADQSDAGASELFIPDGNGLGRFVRLGDDGQPGGFAAGFSFGGQDFSFTADVTGTVDPAGLTRVGCAGPFPASTDPDQSETPFGDLFVQVDGLVLQYGAADAQPDDTAPTTVAEDPTEPPTEAATETPVPTEVPTEIPTETPVPTQVPTEVPTEAPTEAPVPTDVPTDVPTETPAPTDVPTEMPTQVPTETPVPTEEAAATEVPTEVTDADVEPTEVVEATEQPAEPPTSIPLAPIAPPPPGLPAQIEVQNTGYVFSDVTVDVDVQTLVQVEVIVVQNVELTVYARQDVFGATSELFCVGTDGQVVGRYVPAAVAQPEPPETLPREIENDGATYVFNEVEIDIDITTLVVVNVIVVQNVELTLYADPNTSGTVTRLYAAAPDGQVVGLYLDVTLIVGTPQPSPTPQLQPPAVIPTLAPDAPPPAAATAAVSRCTGSAGALDVTGLPERLPRRIQYRGTAFSFGQIEDSGAAGSLTRLGCVGPFDVYSTDQSPAEERLYLRLGSQANSPLYRFDAGRTFTVEVEVTGQVRVVRTSDANYSLVGRYERSIYSSVTAILFVDDAENAEPPIIYALRVDADVVGRYEPESESVQAPADELAEQARQAYVNPDLLLNGRRYVLTEILTPQGSTTNGFVTLYAIPNRETPDLFLGVDPREPDLLVFQRDGGS